MPRDIKSIKKHSGVMESRTQVPSAVGKMDKRREVSISAPSGAPPDTRVSFVTHAVCRGQGGPVPCGPWQHLGGLGNSLNDLAQAHLLLRGLWKGRVVWSMKRAPSSKCPSIGAAEWATGRCGAGGAASAKPCRTPCSRNALG